MKYPAEWEPQDAIWLSWPKLNAHWNHIPANTIQEKWAEITAIISHTQTVRINASSADHSGILSVLKSAKPNINNVELYNHANDDVWCRDHGALFCKHDGKSVVSDWRFNGWGGNFSPWDLDDTIAEKMGASQNIEVIQYDEILEGGAIEINERGTLLTTEAVLLNKNRNPHLDRSEMEKILSERLGVTEVVWLGKGIEGDDTGGHIDDIARFVNNDTILISTASEGANAPILAENQRLLEDWGKAEVIPVPMPEACNVSGWRLPTLPASYVNFLITNENVLVPTFRQKENDDRALSIISEHFPTRQVIGIDSLELVREGGALHCISMQQAKI